jgi:hypothetical protein
LKTGNADLGHPVERFPESNAILRWDKYAVEYLCNVAVVEDYF